jgi:hypothetical protein
VPAWTLSDVISNATIALGNRSDIALSVASFWANESQRVVWDAMPHDLQEAIAVSSTTSGEDKITLPTDFEELLALSNLSDSEKAPLESMNIENADSWVTDLGTPTHYIQYADWLELKPSPDSSYSLQMRYRKALSDMTELTDRVSVGTRFGQAVFLKTSELLAKYAIHDNEKAAEMGNSYIAYMSMTPSDRAKRHRENRFMGLSVPRKRGQTPGTTTRAYDFDTSDN